jgi:hypothetical protein
LKTGKKRSRREHYNIEKTASNSRNMDNLKTIGYVEVLILTTPSISGTNCLVKEF